MTNVSTPNGKRDTKQRSHLSSNNIGGVVKEGAKEARGILNW